MNAVNQTRWILSVTAAALLMLAAGCQSDKPDAVAHGEEFPSRDAIRPVHEFVEMQAANSARKDATLRDYHFDAADLNSLGEERLDLMLRNGDSITPLVVYLDLPEEEAQTALRRQTVLAYLKDRGLTEEQVHFQSGPNPKSSSPVAPLLMQQGAPPAAGAQAGASGGAAPASAGPSMH